MHALHRAAMSGDAAALERCVREEGANPNEPCKGEVRVLAFLFALSVFLSFFLRRFRMALY